MNLNTDTTLQIEGKSKELPPVTIHESMFWDDDDPRRKMTGIGKYVPKKDNKGCHVVDMKTDSYIWCFTGVRGAGKTTCMTLFAVKVYAMYGYRLISNYPIEFRLQRLHGKPEYVKSEPLDLYRLLCFEDDYQDCLILIDEAPDIVSHMASMTWKNRLLNVFIRQLRKNHNSLFLGAQQFELIDKSMRWQTDILAECTDASRKYGWSASERGKLILLRLLDNSGMWTGETYLEKIEKQKHGFTRGYQDPASLKLGIFPRVLWGEEGKTKPVYDTYHVQDVWESLRRVDMHIDSYNVGKKQSEDDPASLPWLQKAIPVIEEYRRAQLEEPERAGFYTKHFYSSVGALSTKEKDALSKRLNNCNVKVGMDGTGKRYYDFSEFDINKFKGT